MKSNATESNDCMHLKCMLALNSVKHIYMQHAFTVHDFDFIYNVVKCHLSLMVDFNVKWHVDEET